MADVSAVTNETPWRILWEMPLADGLLYQATHWQREGIKLQRLGKRGKVGGSKYFRNGRKSKS